MARGHSMVRVYVSVGSNIDRDANVRSALNELREIYGSLIVSTIYESIAVGFEGDNFYNLVLGFDTSSSLHAVAASLREIEERHARVRSELRFRSRTLDLDLLLYGREVSHEAGLQIPRDEIMKYAFVLGPLAEIAGVERHPVIEKTYAELWLNFDQKSQSMWPVG